MVIKYISVFCRVVRLHIYMYEAKKHATPYHKGPLSSLCRVVLNYKVKDLN